MQYSQKKIYALLIEFGETTFISVQQASSLEEAFALAKLEFEKQNLSKLGIISHIVGAKIGLFAIKTLNELSNSNLKSSTQGLQKKQETVSKEEMDLLDKVFDSFLEKDTTDPVIKTKIISIPHMPIKEEETKSPIEEKNNLMKQIIDKKDKNLFEISKSLFSKNECKYIEEHIKK